ncbi:hypothetical protein FRC19_008197 [Serendipita sp. 401]|nr:hypothetical protein FRC19_008197 [Serendipita sp. 401]
MFSLPKLPTQLPKFGILSDDAKLSFRTSPKGVRRLAEEKNIPLTDDDYWSQYVTLFDTGGETFTLISPGDIYRAAVQCPENVATLLRFLVGKLTILLGDHTFPSPPPSITSTLNPFNSLPINITGATERNTTKEALNCIRVLSRVLPVIFGLDNAEWEQEVMWKREAVVATQVATTGIYGGGTQAAEEAAQFVIDDEDDDDAETPILQQNASQPATNPPPERPKLQPSRAERLINNTIDLLFCAGFTLPSQTQVDHHKVQYVIWEKGVGSSYTPSSTSREQSYINSNRAEVLRLLLILFSKQIYLQPSSIVHIPTLYTQYFVQRVPRKLILTTLCSLVNIVVNSAPASNSQNSSLGAGIAEVGKGISKSLNQLPYSQVWKGDDSRAILASLAAQVLVVALDYQSGTARDVQPVSNPDDVILSPGREETQPSTTTAHAISVQMSHSESRTESGPGISSPRTNHFRYFVSRIHRPADLGYLLDGIVGILAEELGQMSSIIGIGLGALQGVGVTGPPRSANNLAQEMAMLLWKLLEINRKFSAYVVGGDRAVDVMACILCLSLELKDKPKSHGICISLSYMMQSLSAEAGFGSQLPSVPIRISLPSKWNTIGTAADFFISSIYAILSPSPSNSGSPQASSPSSYPALIISIANCAPYLKNLSVTSSNKLVQLMTTFADPRILLADEGNPRLVYFMLDAFNSILFHHPSENPHFLYSLLRSHAIFQDLAIFTLARGLRDIKQREEETRSSEHGPNPQAKQSTRNSDASPEAPHEEKARLLAAEGRVSPPLVDRQSIARELESSSPLANTLLNQSIESIRIASPPPTGSSNWSEQRQFASSSGDHGQALSEKARGKLRERDDSLDMSDPALRAAAVAVGKNGFIPTQEWVSSWQRGLPIDPILLAISELLPKVQQIQSSMNRPASSPAVLDFLRVVDLKRVLPQPPPIQPRPFLWTESSLVWITSLIWGDIYVKGMSPLAIWNGTNVRLFYVKQAQPAQRQITEAVSNVMGGILGRGDGSRPRA